MNEEDKFLNQYLDSFLAKICNRREHVMEKIVKDDGVVHECRRCGHVDINTLTAVGRYSGPIELVPCVL